MDGKALEALLESSQEFYGKVRADHKISITESTRELLEGLVIFTVKGFIGDQFLGLRPDVAIGAASLEGLSGIDKANAFKSAETQAKNRLTTSLTGIQWHGESSEKAAEPKAPETPAVSNAPAEVVSDTRVGLADVVVAANDPASQTMTLIYPIPSVSSGAITVPTVSEQLVAAMHTEAQKLNVQTEDKALPAQPPTPPIEVYAESIFDDEPETLVVPQAPTPKPEPVDAVLAALQEPTATGVVMPIPNAKPADQPTRLQFQEFTVRCTKISRSLRTLNDKTLPALLRPYLCKKLGVTELEAATTSISGWEAVLSKLESAGSPAAVAAILKGGN